MTKSLSIILQYLFTQHSNIYNYMLKNLSKKLVLPKIKTYRKYVCFSKKLMNYGIQYQLLFIINE